MRQTMEMSRGSFYKQEQNPQSFNIFVIFEPINISPLCVREQIFEFCGADAEKLEAKIQELM